MLFFTMNRDSPGEIRCFNVLKRALLIMSHSKKSVVQKHAVIKYMTWVTAVINSKLLLYSMGTLHASFTIAEQVLIVHFPAASEMHSRNSGEWRR